MLLLPMRERSCRVHAGGRGGHVPLGGSAGSALNLAQGGTGFVGGDESSHAVMWLDEPEDALANEWFTR